MDAFPFTNTEWNRVQDAAFPLAEAMIEEDDVLTDSLCIVLQETLRELRSKYGDHPVLLETEADFSDDPNESVRLYARALNIAQQNALPTVSICLSYARTLCDQRKTAHGIAVLESCRDQLAKDCDELTKQEYDDLMALLTSNEGDPHL